MGWEMELFALLNAPGCDQARHAATLVTPGCFFTLEKLILRLVRVPHRLRIQPRC